MIVKMHFEQGNSYVKIDGNKIPISHLKLDGIWVYKSRLGTYDLPQNALEVRDKTLILHGLKGEEYQTFIKENPNYQKQLMRNRRKALKNYSICAVRF